MMYFPACDAVADLLTKISRARPLRDPILSILQTFSLKSTHVGGPLPTGPRPPTGNPGSATVMQITKKHNTIYLWSA